jgi:hypothetical protein
VICKSILSLIFLFLSFSNGNWSEKEVFQRYSTSNRLFRHSVSIVRVIEEKDTEAGISCTSNPFRIHEFSVPSRLDWYAVRTRSILPIHYELSRPFGQVHNSSSPQEQNCWGSGLSANGYVLYVWCPIQLYTYKSNSDDSKGYVQEGWGVRPW